MAKTKRKVASQSSQMSKLPLPGAVGQGPPSPQLQALPPQKLQKAGARRWGRLPPYRLFQASLERATNLLKIHAAARRNHRHKRRRKPTPKYLDDAYRAAVALATSALDAYIKATIFDRISAKIWSKKPAKLPASLVKLIVERFKDPTDIVEKAMQSGPVFLIEVEKVLDRTLQTRSYQGVDSIVEGFALIGVDDILVRVAGKTRRTVKELETSLVTYTQRRHAIVH